MTWKGKHMVIEIELINLNCVYTSNGKFIENSIGHAFMECTLGIFVLFDLPLMNNNGQKVKNKSLKFLETKTFGIRWWLSLCLYEANEFVAIMALWIQRSIVCERKLNNFNLLDRKTEDEDWWNVERFRILSMNT